MPLLRFHAAISNGHYSLSHLDSSEVTSNYEEHDQSESSRSFSQLLCRSDAGPSYYKVNKGPLQFNSAPSRRGGLPQHAELDKAHIRSDESSAFVTLLRACGKRQDLIKGTRLHDEILKRGLFDKCSDALVAMYAKCGALAKAKEVFDNHTDRNVFSWTSLITGYARHSQGQNALKAFEHMQDEGIEPDAMTLACVLKVCGSIKAMNQGEQIHDKISREGLLQNDIVLGNVLVDMYVKCGALARARRVLEGLPSRDAVSWNALITGYAQEGQGEHALTCFTQMQNEGISPNAVTFASVLKACGRLKALGKGKKIHNEIVRQCLLGDDIALGNALVDMYAKCGALTNAQEVLEELTSRDVVSWSALIAGYAQEGQGEQALKCFERMQGEGLSPNAVTYASALKACGSIRAFEKGEQIHEDIMRQGLLQKNLVLGTALVDMYAKCGDLTKAREVLEKLPVRNVVSWSALITGYAQCGQGEQALNCFEQMRHEGILPNAVTFACVLKACGMLGAVDKGAQIHDEILQQGFLESDVVLGNALVDMYAKCGALIKARQVLEVLPTRNVVTWNALAAGLAQIGHSEQVWNCLESMRQEGILPNASTFSCMLNACSYRGLVEDGHMYFFNMSTKYDIKPHLDHYICMVNLFGRAGHVDKALHIIQEMPCSDYSEVWFALLGACQKWGDVNVGRWAFQQLVRLDKSDTTAYILMANIYAAAGMQEEAAIIEEMRMGNNR